MSQRARILNSLAVAIIVFFLIQLYEHMLVTGYSNLQTVGTMTIIIVAIMSIVAIIDKALKKKSK